MTQEQMECITDAAREVVHCWIQVHDSLGPPQKAWVRRLDAALDALQHVLEGVE